jgi:hypothetical protein
MAASMAVRPNIAAATVVSSPPVVASVLQLPRSSPSNTINTSAATAIPPTGVTSPSAPSSSPSNQWPFPANLTLAEGIWELIIFHQRLY